MSPPLLAIQLHSLQSVAGLSAQLDLAVRAGFTAVEIIEPHIENGKAMRANLDVRGLSAPSAHVSLGMLRNRPGEVVAGARTAGARQLVVTAPPFATNEADCQAWRALGRELGGLAARLIDTGLTLCFHNHDNELRKLSDGSVPLDLILNEGFHGGLKWQADIAWLVRGGGEPAYWLDRHSDALVSAHVKDIAADPHSDNDIRCECGWADIGHGTIDWECIWAQCRKSGASLMVAERSDPSDPARFARQSFEAMERLATESRLA